MQVYISRIIFVVVASVLFAVSLSAQQMILSQVTTNLTDQQLVFTKSMGQWPGNILFRAKEGVFSIDSKVEHQNNASAFIPTQPTVLTALSSINLVGFNAIDIAVLDTFIYVANSQSGGIYVLNASNPSDLVLVGGYGSFGEGRGLAQEDGYLFLASGNAGLVVFDVTIRTSPIPVGSLPDTCYDIAVQDTIAAILANGSLMLLDVTDPTMPIHLGQVTLASPRTIRIKDSLVVAINDVENDHHYAVIVNIADPTNPMVVDSIYTYTTDIAFCGDYLAAIPDLRMYSLATDSFLNLVGGLNIGTRGIAFTGSKLIIGDHGIKVVDLTNPTNPILLGWDQTDTWPTPFEIVANDSIVFGTDGGILSYDVSDSANPNWLATYRNTGNIYGVGIHDQTAYVLDGDGGIAVIDISDSVNTNLKGFIDVPNVKGIVFEDHFAYLACNPFMIFDIANPDVPQLLSTLDLGTTQPEDIAVSNGIAYIAGGENGYTVVDARDPHNPVMLSQIDTDGVPFGIAAWGSLVYVSDYPDRVLIVDASDPTQPVQVGSYFTPTNINRLTVADGLIYLADDEIGLQIVNVTDPANPFLIGIGEVQGYASEVALSGAYALVVDPSFGLHVFDVSDVSNPVLEEVVGGTGSTGVAVSGSLVALVNMYGAKQLKTTSIIDGSFELFAINQNSGCCIPPIRGDVNNSNNINILDLNFLVAYFFAGGLTPACAGEANVNGIGTLNILDLNALVAYFFAGGVPPAACP